MTKAAHVELSAKAQALPLSGIRVIFDKAALIPGVVHLEIGEPDQATPAHIIKAAEDALAAGYTHYTPSAGTVELREAVARKLRRENGLDYDVDEVMVTSGANAALSLTAFALVNPESEILVPNPGWANYGPLMELVQARPVYYALRQEDEFRPRVEEMESLVTERTRAILLNSPNNPTGGVLEKNDVEGIVELAIKKDLVVITDEVYEKILYDGARHYSIAALDGMRERTVTINAFSKTYRMTGWRLGYAAGPKAVIGAMIRLNSCMNTCSSSISQAAGVAALEGPQGCVGEMVREFRERRDVFVEGLNQIRGLGSPKPKGAFYTFVNVKSLGLSSFDLCMDILEKAKVATVPGVSFGSNGECYLRLSYATSRDQLKEAVSRIRAYVSSWTQT